MKKKLLALVLCASYIASYDLPDTLNLGFNNILEGGPIRPTKGFYWYQYLEYYRTNQFLDNRGRPLENKKGPYLNTLFGCSEFIYQFPEIEYLHFMPGIDVQVYYELYSKIEKNSLNRTTSGGGFSDPYIGLFIQWSPLIRAGRPVFVHRFEFGASFPAGKFKRGYTYNPGNGCYYINPSWAATLYLTPHLAVSTHMNFVWPSKTKYTNVQSGQAIYLNYSIEYECIKDLWLSACGYYLQQITDSKINGVTAPGRREQVFAIGPGALYSVNDDLFFFGYAYFESKVRNRSKGASLLLRSVVHF